MNKGITLPLQLSCLLVDTCIRLRHNVQIKMEEKSNPIFFIDGFVHSAKKG